MIDLNPVYQEIKRLSPTERLVFEEYMKVWNFYELEDLGRAWAQGIDLAKSYTGGMHPTEYKYWVYSFWNGRVQIRENQRKQVEP